MFIFLAPPAGLTPLTPMQQLRQMFDGWCLLKTRTFEQLELIYWMCVHAERQEKEAAKELPFDRRRLIANHRKGIFLSQILLGNENFVQQLRLWPS
jgi:hypothetical protein